LYQQSVWMLFWKHTIIIRKISCQFAAQQEPLVDAKEEVIFVAGKFDSFIAVLTRQFLYLAHRLLGQQSTVRASEPGQFYMLFNHCDAVAIGSHHHQSAF